MQLRLRDADPGDLAIIDEILFRAEFIGEATPARRPHRPILAHEMATGTVAIAEWNGAPAGFAALLTRGEVSNLAELFVVPERQSNGIGAALLARVLPNDGRLLFTLSSTDPRAHAVYIRGGLAPRWPHYLLRAGGDRPIAASPAVEAVPAASDDAELLAWDTRVNGRPRASDLIYLRERLAAQPLWFRRRGAIIGYGYVQMATPESAAFPEAATVGPIGSRRAADAVACVLAAVAWAGARKAVVNIGVPGPHPALRPLIAAGFCIVYVETFLSNRPPRFVDVRRYVPAGSELF